MLDRQNEHHARHILDTIPCGNFVLHDLNFPGYAEMTPAQCRGLGKMLYTSVREGMLDNLEKGYKVVMVNTKARPQIYTKIPVQPPVNETLLKNATFQETIQHLIDLYETVKLSQRTHHVL